jgi:tRNA U34 5-methylaminomethyl-2-thiouridine-forming methyltransferase MnmC
VERKIITTADGSHTISIPNLRVTYHSIYGAIQESRHVFLEAELKYSLDHFANESLNILEMGLGTGLNAFLTGIEAIRLKRKIFYTTVERFPLTPAEAILLNYPDILGHADLFNTIHFSKWNEPVIINEHFILEKMNTDLLNFLPSQHFNLVYYDAFSPNAQPELWSKEVFEKLFFMLEPGGVLVTYCSKGDVKRAMMAAGSTVKKMPGPPGKREMLSAFKS